MSLRDGDTFYPHHPDTVPAGDYCVNTRYDTGGDIFYLVVDAKDDLDTAWDILNALTQDTSWHIHPAIIPYIAMFMAYFIESSFTANKIQTNFEQDVLIDSNFIVSHVETDNINISDVQELDSFSIREQMQSVYTLKSQIQQDFQIVGVFNNTRSGF